MQKILVVGGLSTQPDDVAELTGFGDGIQSLFNAKDATDNEVSHTHLDQLQFVITNDIFDVSFGPQQASLAQFDIVILRSKMRTYGNLAYCLSRFCNYRNIQFFNDYSDYFSGTKQAQAVIFFEQQVPFLPTLFSMNGDYLQRLIGEHFSYPCILKDALGAKGELNFLVESSQHVQDILAKHPGAMFIAQEYCPNDGDYRILLLGREVLVIKRQRHSDSTHLNNTSQGAEATLAPHEVPAEIIAHARSIVRAQKLTIAGVDVILNRETHEWFVLESNSQPQIFTGSFVSEKSALFKKMLLELGSA